jgi:hypothetical protein
VSRFDASDGLPAEPRLFIGIFPGGISYADREVEEHGDYKRLAFLGYFTLTLEIKADCPPELAEQIVKHAASIQARAGEKFYVDTCGHYVTLGR